jgi:hypothetical protein
MEQEVWVPAALDGFTYQYEVSSMGRVKRLATDIRYWNRGCYRHRRLGETIFKQFANHKGYLFMTLLRACGESNRRTVSVARLICRSFHGPAPNEGMHCAHLNGDKRDNRPQNLAWTTPQENCSHKIAHGTQPFGERHHRTRLTEADVKRIRELALSGPRGTKKALAEEYGYSKTAITDICNGRVWSHV